MILEGGPDDGVHPKYSPVNFLSSLYIPTLAISSIFFFEE